MGVIKMKKKIFIILLAFIVFFAKIPFCYVDADEVDFGAAGLGYTNTCQSSSTDVILDGDCDRGVTPTVTQTTSNSDIYITDHKTTTQGCTPDGDIPYSVVFLVDGSGSMQGGTKITEVNKVIKNGLLALKNLDDKANHKVEFNVCVFGSSTECKGWTSVKNANTNKNYFTENDIGGWTYIQNGLQEAYYELNKSTKKDSNAPMVILLTDGYPTVYDQNYKIGQINEKDNVPNKSKDKHFVDARYIYYTAKTLLNLKDKLRNESGFAYKENTKIMTFGTGLNKNGELAKFLLNPNKANYDNLNNGDFSTEAKTLYNLAKGRVVYTGVARMTSAIEDGVSRVTVNKSTRTATFEISNKSFQAFWSKWDKEVSFDPGKYYRLSFKVPFTRGQIESVKIEGGASCKSGKTCWTKFDPKDNPNDNVPGHSYWSFKINKEFITNKRNGQTVKVEVKYKSGTNLETYGGTSYDNPFATSGGVDSSMIGSTSDVANQINSLISITTECNPTSTSSDTPYKYTSNSYDKYQHGSICIANPVTLSTNAYYKVPSSLTFGNNNKSVTLNDIHFYQDTDTDFNTPLSCVPVNKVSVPVVVTEASNFSLQLGYVPYRGSGFTLKNGLLTNSISWYYGASRENAPTANISFTTGSYYLKSNGSDKDNYSVVSNSYGNLVKISTLKNINLSDLYSNSNCTAQLYTGNIDETIWGSLKSNINSSVANNLANGALTSVDSNNPLVQNATVGVTVEQESSGDSLGHSTFDERKSLKYDFKLLLNKACIAQDDNVDGSTNGFIRYLETPNGDCSSLNGDYVDGFQGVTNADDTFSNVNQYYIPTKYPGNTVYLNVNSEGASLSSYLGVSIKYGLSCPANIGNSGSPPDLYTCEWESDAHDNYTCSLNYQYRAIDVSKPFTASTQIPKNWKDWYVVQSNKERISNTFNNVINYSIILNKGNGSNIEQINTVSDSYKDWKFESGGTVSKFVDQYFNGANNGNVAARIGENFCPLGEFNENCNRIVG